jgi:glycosyltransferase involved in cell wall biosynthesis
MNSLTTHIITQNNEKTIEKAIESLLPLECEILIGDLGSKDETIQLAKKYRTKIISLKYEEDFSKARNALISYSSSKSHFYIEPWEFLVSGHEVILENMNYPHKVYIQQNESLSKEIRLWQNGNFINPAFERLDIEGTLIPVFLYSTGEERQDIGKIIRKWETEAPTAKDVIYYKAYHKLTNNNYTEFLRLAINYLFLENKISTSTILTRYYCAFVHYKVFNNYTEAIQNLIAALAAYPFMAEFWCLLGDCFIKMGQYNRAAKFYENAIFFGARRKQNDDYPIEIAKYKEYPEKLLNVLRTDIFLQ